MSARSHGCSGRAETCNGSISSPVQEGETCRCACHLDEKAPLSLAPAGEPAPTDDAELARLLPGLAHDIAMVAGVANFISPGASSPSSRLARASELLLAERGRVATLREADGHEVRAWIANAVTEQSRADEAERKLAEVAALQRTTAADLDAARAQLRIVQAGREDVWHWQGDGRDDPASLVCPVVMSAETLREFVAARERVAELERRVVILSQTADAGEIAVAALERMSARVAEVAATPPPHTVAALLAKVEEEAGKCVERARSQAYSWDRANYAGQAAGLRDAARLITATLGAPTPLDRAVGEVLARAKGFADQRYPGAWLDLARETADAQDGNHRENAIECAGLCLRAVLACDAPATKEPDK